MISHQSISAKARSPWTEERVVLLKELHAANASCAIIAAEINEKTGSSFTKNSVIGITRRLKLEGRGVGFRHSRPYKKKKLAANNWHVITPDAFVPRSSGVLSLSKPLLDLRAMECHWPDKDRNADGLHTFCARMTDGGPYCCAHKALGIEPRKTPFRMKEAA